jgi:hypothetical protein
MRVVGSAFLAQRLIIGAATARAVEIWHRNPSWADALICHLNRVCLQPKFSETAWLQSVEKMVPPPKILVKVRE